MILAVYLINKPLKMQSVIQPFLTNVCIYKEEILKHFTLECYVSRHRDHPLRTLLIAPITEHKHMLSSDGQKFPPWLKFQELRNFCISLIVFDVQLMLQNGAVHHCCVTNLQSSRGQQISLKLTCGVYVVPL